MPHDVFISYSSADKAIADAACAALEVRNVRCWIAPRDVPPGKPWARAVVDAIDESRVFVLIFSAESNRSPQVFREVNQAIGSGVTVLPVRIEDIEPTGEMEYYISLIHWLDAFAPPLEAHLQALAEQVEKLVLEGDSAPQGLRVSLLGPPRVERDGVLCELGTDSDVALLAYLAVTGQSHSRESLAGLLWPDRDPTRAREFAAQPRRAQERDWRGGAGQRARERRAELGDRPVAGCRAVPQSGSELEAARPSRGGCLFSMRDRPGGGR